jgi:hypothetical protein
VKVSEKLVRQAVVRAGGRIERAGGEEVLVIPVVAPTPGELEQCWEPRPPANSKFTGEEMEKITAGSVAKQLQKQVDKFAPGWKIAKCGPDMDPGLRGEFRGRKNVLATHPLNQGTGCVLAKTVKVPAGKKTSLRLVVTHDPRGDWTLLVRADGKKLLEKKISPATVTGDWLEVSVDLSRYAGRSVRLELVNGADGWSFEAGYWAEIGLVEG